MNRTLLSFAIVKTNWEQQKKDYIDNFIPLVGSLIKKKQYSEINLDNLETYKKEFKEEYGLCLPSQPLLTILNKLSKLKYIDKKESKFIPNFDKILEID